jgi:molybdenum cofactor cytidylyltransferase
MPDNTSNIAIVILAAGASKRMGTPKQLLKWGEESLLGHSISKALKVEASEVIVVLGANYKSIEKEIKQFPLTILKNENWGEGLGKSIACATKYILELKPKISGLLIVLADQPFIDTDFLNNIIQKFSQNQNQIIATAYENGKNGVPVLFDSCYFDELCNISDDNGAKHLLNKYQSFVISLQFQHQNLDIDSKADYEILYDLKFGYKGS